VTARARKRPDRCRATLADRALRGPLTRADLERLVLRLALSRSVGARSLGAQLAAARDPSAWLEAELGAVFADTLETPPRWLALEATPRALEVVDRVALAELVASLDTLDLGAETSRLVDAVGALRAELFEGLFERERAWTSGDERRRRAAHYTPYGLALEAAERALAPLFARAPTAEELHALRVVDPTMGAGVFLLASLELLRRASLGRERGVELCRLALCLRGVDADPVAVDLARILVYRATGGADAALAERIEARLVLGDASVGDLFEASTERARPKRSDGVPPIDWRRSFADVAARGGFDAVVGNPPWIAYAGRAAQPLSPELRAYHQAEHRAFAGYRSLHGVMVERSARLLRAGGRLGLIVPTSMADLTGYGPARAAHDAQAEPDAELVDLGAGAFAKVFQPAMLLCSTRRGEVCVAPPGEWALERRDLDPAVRAWLTELDHAPTLPAESFGERGVQTTGVDHAHFSAAPGLHGQVPIRSGGDIAPFCAKPASRWVDPHALGTRLRSPEVWHGVGVLIRQTARFPVAARADGVPFRNSLLAGFGTSALGASGLLALLNSAPARFLHFHRFRDARQGMPQVKIAQLRRTPALGLDTSLRRELEAFGEQLGLRNRGIDSEEQARLDAAVAALWKLPPGINERIRVWSRATTQAR
jgi:hypothetical protein